MAPSSAVLALLVTLGMTLVPSLLFLGLWRGLLRLRDDRLVDEVLARAEVDRGPGGVVGPGSDANPFLSDGTDGPPARSSGPVGCPSCGVLRAPGETCPACGTEPDGE
ncbi:zinc ribbon domain-containing protein [Halobaculum sp. MBLA0143]|uniref:zinc ribbon domain-containing protein n=1 Tax=Halobaculum sp. MBLA0143 TaxID=3079933 RepID=UPI00352489C6